VQQVPAWTKSVWGIPMISISRGWAGGLLTLATAFYSVPVSAKPAARLILTPERMSELRQINSQYGREDVWTLPTNGRGDCEDFALLKRKLLLQRGWPASALSISVGTTLSGEPHAVLIVTTASGEYVLDNLTSSILPSSQTGHTFLSRQSGRGWVSASGARTSEPTVDLPVARSLPVAQAGLRRPRGWPASFPGEPWNWVGYQFVAPFRPNPCPVENACPLVVEVYQGLLFNSHSTIA
jgi:Bacterial transglutaminase-like cysteine proteinase BTLCP